MFGLPAQTFWLIAVWPLVWVLLALILYFKFKRDDDREEEAEN